MPVEDGREDRGRSARPRARSSANLLQNAFKFTAPRTTVTLRVGATEERVLIEIRTSAAACRTGTPDELFRPFEELAPTEAARASASPSADGASKRTMAGFTRSNCLITGCVFTIDLPRLPVPTGAAV